MVFLSQVLWKFRERGGPFGSRYAARDPRYFPRWTYGTARVSAVQSRMHVPVNPEESQSLALH
jgi:hypothetical protein